MKYGMARLPVFIDKVDVISVHDPACILERAGCIRIGTALGEQGPFTGRVPAVCTRAGPSAFGCPNDLKDPVLISGAQKAAVHRFDYHEGVLLTDQRCSGPYTGAVPNPGLAILWPENCISRQTRSFNVPALEVASCDHAAICALQPIVVSMRGD